MLHRILWAALVAGVVAGLATATLQHFTTTPLILEAEKYEGGGNAGAAVPSLFGGAELGEAQIILIHDHGEHAADDEGSWAPSGGVERTFFTTIATIGLSFGFALILLSVMILAGARIEARSGLLWGIAAFAATGLAPALGLSPELPGSAAAALGARQFWWIGTAVATAAGLWLALRISTWPAIAAGIALMILPHLIGAPHPQEFTSAVPSELSGHFASASLVVHAVTWVLAGAVAGYIWQRGETKQAAAA